MTAANAAIEKAMTTSRNTIKITTTTIPTQRDESKSQLSIDIPPVTVIEVTVPKGKGK